MNRPSSLGAVGVLLLVAAGGAAWYAWAHSPGTTRYMDPVTYEQTVVTFYRGVAALDTGLLDNARVSLQRATELAPDEPASWANLGLVSLRGGDFDAAAAAVARATALAPRDADIALLDAALENARGRLDASTGALRRAVELDSRNQRARFALADALERSGGAGGDRGAAQQLESLLADVPDNLAVLIERTRLAAKRSDAALLADSVRRLDARAQGWPEIARTQLSGLSAAVSSGDIPGAQRAVAFLRNVLLRVGDYRQDLAAVRVPAELMADPLDRFVSLPVPPARPDPPDTALTYAQESLGGAAAMRVLAWPPDASATTSLFAADATSVRRIAPPQTWTASADLAMVPLDWNHDFRTDLLTAGSNGAALLVQQEDGTLVDGTRAAGIDAAVAGRIVTGAWTADLDMDGDLDLVIGIADADSLVLRNSGAQPAQPLRLFRGVHGVRGFTWSDVDADGDPDPVLLDAAGTLHVFGNQQAGSFAPLPTLALGADALTSGDLDGDGVIELVTLDPKGVVRRAVRMGANWDVRPVATWEGPPSSTAGSSRLLIADMDNNGGMDLIASSAGASQLWLSGPDGALGAHALPPGVEVFSVADLNDDGTLDIVGIAGGKPVRLLGRGTRGYHWQSLRLRAQTAAGDQRINAFGVGGEVEVRAGLLVQKQQLTGAPVHIGLGSRTSVDVARIVWPNGVMQAEFDWRADQPIVAEQRLKGSCPWVFADNGSGMAFVTDFLWRSPLGLRINAQDTAGVTQSEDWVRIRGDQLAARNGRYDLRITAELWESHFFDHVSLMVVDHPGDTELFVDERFSRQAPHFKPITTGPLHALAAATDNRGRDLMQAVNALDGVHAAGFDRGMYQGVAPRHSIEVMLGEDAPAAGELLLVAQGWVYPTDSSINVALAQSGQPPPQGLTLEAQDRQGHWHTLDEDAGLPAGKNKTLLLDLSGRPSGARKFRLSTTMEIYWDRLAWAIPQAHGDARVNRIAATTAELRYRGFSQTSEDRAAHAPETPRYDTLANTAPRWRDLVGYHTRFGDVRELIVNVDDRYVIMNAGDEMRLEFVAPAAAAQGWRRDFILVGDGWEKDGDFNTGYSQTVLPLPRHGHSDYRLESPELEDDPAYRAHPEDWQRFHTRYVSPDRYLLGLRAAHRPR